MTTMRTHDTHPETRYFVQSVERALRILRGFADDPSGRNTLTQLAEATGLSKPTVRRFLLTLRDLGYLEAFDRQYRLTPKVLEIGFAFLAGLDFPRRAQPLLERLSERAGESTNMTILDGTEIVYVARVAVKRIISTNILLGSRLPAYCTSLGKVLLANLSNEEIIRRYDGVTLKAYTPSTITGLDELLTHLREVRREGYAINNEELELGLRSVAAPIHDVGGKVIASVNLSSSVSRVSLAKLRDEFLPLLLETAREISKALGFGVHTPPLQ